MKIESAIKQMYYGIRGQGENMRATEEDIKLVDKLETCENELKEKLESCEGGLELYEKAKAALENVWQAIVTNNYTEGFKFGLLMGLEIIAE